MLHLHEIGALEALTSLRRILIPDLVAADLETFRLPEPTLAPAVKAANHNVDCFAGPSSCEQAF